MKTKLSQTPLQTWGAESLYREAMRAARIWRNEPGFNSGGAMDTVEDRAQEIISRVLGYIKKRGISTGEAQMDQVTLFHRVAAYSKFGMVQQCYGVKTTELFEDEAASDVRLSNEQCAAGNACECSDAEGAEQKQEMQNRLKEIFKKIGIKESDWAIFDGENDEIAESLGVCERSVRQIRSKRGKEIIEKIKTLGLRDEIKAMFPRWKFKPI